MNVLEIQNLHAEINNKPILNGINLTIRSGEIHALMGPNGSGKSTLSNVLMGHPSYKVTHGKILFNGQNLLSLSPTERALAGLFLAFQYPIEVPGVKLSAFLRKSYLAHNIVPLDTQGRPTGSGVTSVLQFQKTIQEKLTQMHLPIEFAQRELNTGFSGGEKKRTEILQLSLLKSKLAILDEIDSGLDIDAVRTVAENISQIFQENKREMAILMITHYQRILEYIQPDYVHVFVNGRIVKSGNAQLAKELERTGYASVQEWKNEWSQSQTLK